MKNFIIACFAIIISACDASTVTINDYILPPALSHCQVYRMQNTGGTVLNVVHCPNATTATQVSEKSPKMTIVIDGVEYERKSETKLKK